MKQKIWEKVIAIVCIAALILPISSEVIAAIQNTAKDTKLNFGISVMHKSKTLDKKNEVNFGYAIATSQQPAYRIYSGENDYETTILCLNKDLRYPQQDGKPNAEYTSQGKATRETLKAAKSGLTDDQADAILWLVRNAVIPEDSEALKDQKLAKIFDSIIGGTTENKLTLDEIKSVLTEDDLVFALQFSIWKLTNGVTWGSPQGTEDGQNWDGLTGNDKWGYSGKKGEYIKKIVQFYSDNQNGDDIIKVTEGAAKPEFEDTNVTTAYESRYAFVGPFKIKETNTDYSVKITLYKEDGTELPKENYYLRKKVSVAKEDLLDKTKKDLNGTEFYIQLNQTSEARKVKIELSTPIQLTSAEGTVWTREAEDQPLLSIKRTEQPGENVELEKEFDINPPTKYDAALRKNIETVYRKESSGWKNVWNATSSDKHRQPVKQPTSESDSPFNQYDYYHVKEPVEVKVGDIVVYNITVINEGKDKLKVTRIEDYLPPSGLRYLDDTKASDSVAKEVAEQLELKNSNYWTQNNSKNGATSTTTENTVLSEGDSTHIKIACEVTTAATGKVVTNIAEITQIADEHGSTIQDIDSVPEDINLPQDEQSWQNYKGNQSNTNDLSQTNYYYKGQEDDDDFEKIKVEGTIDLALRKSITTINGSAQNRAKDPDRSPLRDNSEETTTSNFTDVKTPVSVKPGDIVVYNIRIYNEGQEEASAGKIEDYIPEGLGFLPQYNLNTSNGWIASEGATSVKLSTIKDGTKNVSQSDFNSTLTDYKNADVIVGKATVSTTKLKDVKIAPYDAEKDEIDKEEVQIACIVLDTIETDTIIKNIAAITEYRNSSGNVVTTDVDSNTTDQINPDTYPADTNIQDDDDFEKLILAERVYDLALKKFITGVTSADGTAKTIPDDQKRVIGVKDVTALKNRTTDTKADAEYEFLNKEPVEVEKGDYVTYTIRIFNEGVEDAIVKEVVDTVPEGLEFVTYETNEDGTYKSGSNINFKYGWKKFNESTTTTGWQDGIKTTYLENTTIPGFDANETTDSARHIEKGISYVDIQVEFRVITDESNPITNIAEITEDDGDDNDSTPNNKNENEDDEDYDVIIPQKFDLALRKFITSIDNKEIIDRIPKPVEKDGKIEYEHPKDPKVVVEGQTVVYTIRVYNEGNKEGYAAEIKDDLPEGITFLPENDVNKKYGWKMYNAEGEETTEVSEATTIRTTYLSKEESDARNEDNLLKAFDSTKAVGEGNPDYRDVKVAFEVTKKNVTDGNKVIINTAEISEDEDKDGKETQDVDSIPNNGKEEDDIDKEYLELKYFDLSLLKYVSKVIVTEDGVVKETETGYDGTENPEPVVKVEINKNKLNKTEVKYVYSIKVTNEGEIEGYATEVSDRIPSGLAFYEEDNTQYNWKVKEDGIVSTDYLKDTLLKPGDSAIIQIVLRWERSANNLGQKVNVAEITEDDNEYDVPDIDSTPNNNKEGEDDQDEAIVVLSISTGSTPVYIAFVIIIVSLIGIGIFTINKYVIKK